MSAVNKAKFTGKVAFVTGGATESVVRSPLPRVVHLSLSPGALRQR